MSMSSTSQTRRRGGGGTTEQTRPQSGPAPTRTRSRGSSVDPGLTGDARLEAALRASRSWAHTASVGKRLLAYTIDVAAVLILATVAAILTRSALVGAVVALELGIVQCVIEARTGITLGNACLRLRTVRDDAPRSPGVRAAAIRGVILLGGFLVAGIGGWLIVATAALDPRRAGRTWADRAGHTLVVAVPTRAEREYRASVPTDSWEVAAPRATPTPPPGIAPAQGTNLLHNHPPAPEVQDVAGIGSSRPSPGLGTPTPIPTPSAGNGVASVASPAPHGTAHADVAGAGSRWAAQRGAAPASSAPASSVPAAATPVPAAPAAVPLPAAAAPVDTPPSVPALAAHNAEVPARPSSSTSAAAQQPAVGASTPGTGGAPVISPAPHGSDSRPEVPPASAQGAPPISERRASSGHRAAARGMGAPTPITLPSTQGVPQPDAAAIERDRAARAAALHASPAPGLPAPGLPEPSAPARASSGAESAMPSAPSPTATPAPAGETPPVTGVPVNAPEPRVAAQAEPPVRESADPPSGVVSVGNPVPRARVPRPREGELLLVFDTGQRVQLPIPVVAILGRKPDRTSDLDQVVAIGDPEGTVSKTHLRIEYQRGSVWVTDLGSTNGTHIIDDDGDDAQLPAGGRALVSQGARVRIGNRVFTLSTIISGGSDE
ncbi:FHA domain-containing protein [Mycetocola lacteus]|uniref:FHA domain-containing protein n=1 Tax=Mycetocola lacteus TaxID=76637 RepID=A0A3L7AR51_9MICO|nr:RDD family protein [Mycetocola lacteus]RLP82050.1 FHA domain-containing protein [Mycetocola lacteus]